MWHKHPQGELMSRSCKLHFGIMFEPRCHVVPQSTYHVGSSNNGGHPGGSSGQVSRKFRLIHSRSDTWRKICERVHTCVSIGAVSGCGCGSRIALTPKAPPSHRRTRRTTHTTTHPHSMHARQFTTETNTLHQPSPMLSMCVLLCPV